VRTYIEAVRYSLNVINRDITFATLDRTKIGAVHINVVSKVLLTYPEFFAATSDIRSNNSA